MGLVVQQEKTQAEDGGRHEGGETTPTLRVDEHGTGREGGVGGRTTGGRDKEECVRVTHSPRVWTRPSSMQDWAHTHTQSGQGEQGN